MSRAERLDLLKEQLADIRCGVEELSSELEAWHDNMPENLQGGEKYSMLEEAISQLEEIINYLNEASEIEVEFPGAF